MASFEIKTLGNDLTLKNKYGAYSKKELEYQLKEGHLTIKELANIYNLKTYQMLHVIRSLGIVYRNILGDTRIENASITPSMHQVLIGTLLGDGYMKTNRMYGLGHGVYQLEYLYHVAERLNKFIASIGDRRIQDITRESYEFWTYSHKNLFPYYERFYSRGKEKKYITSGTVPDLSAEGLAYWFMDDGKYGEYGMTLCVGNISEQEGKLLLSVLRMNFDLDATFHFVDREKDYHHIYIKANSREKFLNIISPYIIPSLRYKITGDKIPSSLISTERILCLHKNLCRMSGRPIRYFGDKEIINEMQSFPIESSKKKFMAEIKKRMHEGLQISRTLMTVNHMDEKLKSLFDSGLNDYQVASIMHLGRNRLRSWRQKNNIRSKTNKKGLSPSICDEVFQRYQNGESFTQIAKDYDVSRTSLTRLLRKNGFIPESLVRRIPSDLINYKLSPDQISILVGDIFGDGHISQTSNKSGCYTCSHNIEQEEFVLWKYNALKPLSNRLFYGSQIDKRTMKKHDYVSMSTWSHKSLLEWRKRFYIGNSGPKILRPDLVQYLTPLSLATWFMGDGTRDRSRMRFVLGLDQDAPAIAYEMNKKFGTLFRSKKHKKEWSIYVENPKKFLDLTGFFVLSCFNYKIQV